MQAPEAPSVVDILPGLADSVVTIGADRRIIAMNRPAEALIGCREAEAVGRPCAETLRCEICATARCPFEAAYARDETVTTFDVALHGVNGGATPVCINTSPLKDASGAVRGVVETIREVSHVRRLVEEVRGQRNQARAILDSVTDGVITLDREGGTNTLNRTARLLLGRGDAETRGRPWHEVLAVEGTGEARAIAQAIAAGVGLRDREVVLRGRNGAAIAAALTLSTFRDDDGQRLGTVLTFRDLGEIERIAEVRRSRAPLGEIVGRSPRLRAVLDLMETVADSDSTVLLQGESGTGKGLFARAIHQVSGRRDRSFVKVSCGALPETLLESALFGHERGAFTGAIRARRGRLEAAHRGTIFLDEIGDLGPAIQVRLLRVLQEHEFERPGSNDPVRLDVRVIAATRRPLRRLMEEGRFREDLFYRLDVIPIHIPPLRDRPEDIPLLVGHILGRLAARRKGRGVHLSPRTLAVLEAYHWPGNVRELENVLEHAVVCSPGPVVEPDALPEALVGVTRDGEAARGGIAPEAARTGRRAAVPLARRGPAGLVREEIVRALEASGWRRVEAARRLGVERTTLWRHMRRLGILVPAEHA